MFVNTSLLPLVLISPPTLIQDTIGGGIPDTLHNRVKFPPSVRFTFCNGCMDEATKTRQQQLISNGESPF